MTIGTAADYVGRTVDLVAFHGADPARGEVQLLQALVPPGTGGEVCTGIQKLVQRWAVEFLTVAGTMQYLPLRGCDFVGQARRGELVTAIDAQQAFVLSARQVQSNLRREDPADAPDDEVLASADLLSITVAPGFLSVTVRVNSVAGDSAKIILPIGVKVG